MGGLPLEEFCGQGELSAGLNCWRCQSAANRCSAPLAATKSSLKFWDPETVGPCIRSYRRPSYIQLAVEKCIPRVGV